MFKPMKNGLYREDFLDKSISSMKKLKYSVLFCSWKHCSNDVIDVLSPCWLYIPWKLIVDITFYFITDFIAGIVFITDFIAGIFHKKDSISLYFLDVVL